MTNKNEMSKIMVVDDEDMVTISIKSFLDLETDYGVITFTSPTKALEYLKEGNSVDLIVSDFLMPDMDGIEFLLQVKHSHPEVTRILLTGYADKENAIKAINDVGLYQYIEKPWDNEDMRLIIKNGLEKKILLKKLQDKIREVEKAHNDLRGVHNEILKAFV